jgi:hypothetical protein
MSGFGKQGFGSTPWGVGMPATAPIPGGVLLRNPSTGESMGSRSIDPAKRDYVLDVDGRALGMASTQQLVLMAVSTVKRSSAVASLGAEQNQDVITDSFERDAQAMYGDALADLVNRKIIVIIAIEAQLLKAGTVYVRVRWLDVATGQEHLTET